MSPQEVEIAYTFLDHPGFRVFQKFVEEQLESYNVTDIPDSISSLILRERNFGVQQFGASLVNSFKDHISTQHTKNYEPNRDRQPE